MRFELLPIDRKKSFYGKCFVEVENDVATLYSYNTRICAYNTKSGVLTKYPDFGYSATTNRHTRAFFAFYGIKEEI